jgi:hypothetical protein
LAGSDSTFFETVPAWRIARLRTTLRDAEQRGANLDDDGGDLVHRALRRRFALARLRTRNARAPSLRPKSTRKGRAFPLRKQVAIWRAILDVRPQGWRPGDRASPGSIRRAHAEAGEACRAAGLAPPRYRTIYVLWHRGTPSGEVIRELATLRSPPRM